MMSLPWQEWVCPAWGCSWHCSRPHPPWPLWGNSCSPASSWGTDHDQWPRSESWYPPAWCGARDPWPTSSLSNQEAPATGQRREVATMSRSAFRWTTKILSSIPEVVAFVFCCRSPPHSRRGMEACRRPSSIEWPPGTRYPLPCQSTVNHLALETDTPVLQQLYQDGECLKYLYQWMQAFPQCLSERHRFHWTHC